MNASPGLTRRRRLLARLLGYGASRTATEALFAGRGLLLAGILGPELFGIWALFRIAMRYLAFAGFGLFRGLEFEVSRAGDGPRGRGIRTEWGRAAVGYTVLVFGLLSLLGGLAWASLAVRQQSAGIVLLGIGIGLLIDRLWMYGATYLRVSNGLRRYAVVELVHAGLQFVLCTLLALRWGVPGALAGFAIAHLAGVALLIRRVPLRPTFELQRVRRLVSIGLPVSLTGVLNALLTTADRLLVGAFLGLSGLGLYAFAVAVSQLGVSLAVIVRTVILRDVYARKPLSNAGESDAPSVHRALSGLAVVAPLVTGALALCLPPVLDLLAPDYRNAALAAQLLLFAGLLQGLINVAMLEIVANARQGRTPLLSLVAIALEVVLAVGALSLGFGLQGVATAALFTRIALAASVVSLLQRRQRNGKGVRQIVSLLIPTVWCTAIVCALDYWLHASDLSMLLSQLLIYAFGVAPLLPLINDTLAKSTEQPM